MNTQKNAVLIANVKQEFEAVSIVAALGDAGISAVRQQATKGGLFSLPGAMGLPEEGYDILVASEDAGNALDILIGM
ncbi:MAG: hypothetical protein IJP17_01390, partial [Clostridia bacterium]|nr:hypothetical protein [Clostridia bacterium]